MATNFPTSLDSLTNPTSTDGLSNPSHSSQHADANDAIEALEAKVGVNSSAVTTSLDYRMSVVEPFFNFGFTSGQYYIPNKASNPNTAINDRNQNLVYYQPMFIGTKTTFDRIAVTTSATFSGTASIRLGIYNNSGGAPSSLVLDAGTVSPTAGAVTYAVTISQSLNAGWYWLAYCCQTVATSNLFAGGGSIIFTPWNRWDSVNLRALATWQQSSVTGAFPSTATPVASSVVSLPFVMLRAL